jgi:hypothetical protein
MEYKGKLYGKVGSTYFPLLNTTEDWDNLENKVNELQEVVNKNCNIPDVSKSDGLQGRDTTCGYCHRYTKEPVTICQECFKFMTVR